MTKQLPSFPPQPRVVITYEAGAACRSEEEELPFVIAVMADLGGDGDRSDSKGACFEYVDSQSFASFLTRIRPRLLLEVPDLPNGGQRQVDIVIRSMDDFSSSAVATALRRIRGGTASGMGAECSAHAVDGTSVSEEFDACVERQVQAIVGHRKFLALEAVWRGLHRLVVACDGPAGSKLKVLDITKPTLREQLSRNFDSDWREGALFRSLNARDDLTPRETVVGCIVGDYYFGSDAEDLELLDHIGRFCEAVHVPFISGAAPSLVGLRTWGELRQDTLDQKADQSSTGSAWHLLREKPYSRYLYLAMPRYLADCHASREHASATQPAGVEADPAPKCWANSAYLMAENLVRAFRQFGWFARIRGLETGGAVSELSAG